MSARTEACAVLNRERGGLQAVVPVGRPGWADYATRVDRLRITIDEYDTEFPYQLDGIQWTADGLLYTVETDRYRTLAQAFDAVPRFLADLRTNGLVP